MKDTLTTGIELTRRHSVEKDDTIGFMGEDLRVYATPALVGHMEHTCRDFILEHLDDGEDTVGTRVEIDHMAPTMSGMWAEIKVTVAEIQGRLVTLEFEAWDEVEPIAKGRHMRFIVDKAKTAERLAAKAAKASSNS
ncbi:MAG: LysR family transcriptional regulator [Rhodospirillaceae bacterium]|nr:LysR family transcriptional regulator [Rhodospirillaceae bacterium]MBL6932321.1 LysR family transcriptional regulator [Rhodospirillales bacterium]